MRIKLLPFLMLLSAPLTLYPQGAPSPSADQHQNRAASLMLNGEYEAAIPELLAAAGHYKAAGQWKHYFSCLNHTATAFLKTGKMDEAKRVAKKALWESIQRLGRDNEEAARASHKLAETYSRAGRHDDAMQYHKMGLQIRRSLHGDDHPSLADSYDWMGKAWQARQDYEQAQKHFELALELRKSLLGAEHPGLAASLYLLGELKAEQGQLKEAQEFHQKALAIRRKRLGPQHPETGHSLSRLAYITQQAEGLEAALESYRQAAGIFIRNKTYGGQAEGEALHWLAWSQYLRADYAGALANARLAALGLSSSAVRNEELATRNRYLLAKAYLAKGDFGSAASRFELLLNDPEMPFRADCFHQLVEALLHAGRPATALESAKAFLAWAQAQKGQAPQLEGDAQLQVGKAQLALGHKAAGLAALAAASENSRTIPAVRQEARLQAALALQEDGQHGKAIKELNQVITMAEEDGGPGARLIRLKALLALGEAQSQLALQGDGAIEHREMALHSFHDVDELLFSMAHSSLAGVWKASLAGAMESLYPKALQVVYELYQMERGQKLVADAFYFSERQKLLSLQLDILSVPELEFAGVPDALRQQEGNLRRKAEAMYHAQAFGALPADGTMPAPDELAQTEAAFQPVLTRLKEEALAYYQLRYSGEVVDAQGLCSLLSEEEASLYAYFQAKDYLYIFYTEDKQLKMARRPLQGGLAASLYSFREQLRQAPAAGDSLYASARPYQALAFSLYESLMPAGKLPEKTDKLFLLPHGGLHFFPFEALVAREVENPHYGRLAYLGAEREIVYYSSASQMAGQRLLGDIGEYDWKAAALIADYAAAKAANEKEYARGANYSQAKLKPMPSFASLARNWCSRSGGLLLEGNRVTEGASHEPPSAEQLVLAAHAILSPEPGRSFIALYGLGEEHWDKLFSAQSLFRINRPTGISILPSCLQMPAAERGWPVFLHALMYSGTKSLLFHRWENTGESSARLAALFLEKSAEGQRPAAALSAARRHYLQSVEGSRALAHPHYWAGYAFFDGRSIQQASYGDSPYWILGAVGMLILIGLWSRHR